MKTLENYLNENITFRNGSDQDYPLQKMAGNKNPILLWKIEDLENYKVEGETHGEKSHAIKHLIEFDKGFVEGKIAEAKKAVECLCTRKHPVLVNTSGEIIAQGKEALNQADTEAFLTLCDLINDKWFEPVQQRTSFENKIASIVNDALGMRYDELLNKKMRSSKRVDYSDDYESDSEKEKLVKDKSSIVFDVSRPRRNGRGTENATAYLNFRDGTLILKSKNEVRTMYKLDNDKGYDMENNCFSGFKRSGYMPVDPKLSEFFKSKFRNIPRDKPVEKKTPEEREINKNMKRTQK